MDKRNLTIFLSAAATENYRQTARDNGLSQAAVSQQIRVLEAELGVDLFRKSGRGVEITDAGKVLAGTAKNVLREIDEMGRIAHMLRRNELGRIVVGYSTSLMSERRLPLVLRQFSEAHPSVEIRPSPLLVADAMEALSERRIDIAVVRAPLPLLPDDLVATPFDEARLMLAVPNGDLLEGKTSVGWKELDNRIVLTIRDPEGVGLREVTRRLLAQQGVKPAQIRLVGDMTALVGLIAAGVGVALLPEDIARAHRGVSAMAIGPHVSKVASMIVTHREIVSPMVRHLCERLGKAKPPSTIKMGALKAARSKVD